MQVFEAACVLGAVVLIAVHAVRLAAVPEVYHWSVLVLILLGLPAADFLSGVIHWLGDTWGSESAPWFGPRFLKPFRYHHVNPRALTESHFFTTNGDTALVSDLFLLAAFLLPLDSAAGRSLVVFTVAFCAWGLPTSQYHKWAHLPTPPRWVAWLQRRRLILSPEHHAAHHVPPYAQNYCITTGWCNPVLTAIRFFPALEWCISRLTGATPRCDARPPAAQAPVRR
jgi:ubiquitin-conjugating enzyme E2 variant